MKRSIRTATTIGLLAALTWTAAGQGGFAQQRRTRDLLRTYIKKIDQQAQQKQLASAVGLPDVGGGVVALEYAVLLEKDGEQIPIPNPDEYEFHVGDQIRVRIQPLVDVYIYIFHEGASGQQVCLLPQKQEKSPLAKAGQPLVLPLDDSVFEFSEPTGKEKLIVVAAENPNQDLALLSNVVFKKDDSELTAEERQVKERLSGTFQKVLKSVSDKARKTAKHRGLISDQTMAKFAANKSKTRAVVEEPATAANPTAFAMAANSRSAGKPELFLSIPLNSVPVRPASN
jgi:hypothetical protein